MAWVDDRTNIRKQVKHTGEMVECAAMNERQSRIRGVNHNFGLPTAADLDQDRQRQYREMVRPNLHATDIMDLWHDKPRQAQNDERKLRYRLTHQKQQLPFYAE